MKRWVLKRSSIEDTPRQAAEFSIARLKVMNISTDHIDHVYKDKTTEVVWGRGETDSLFRNNHLLMISTSVIPGAQLLFDLSSGPK